MIQAKNRLPRALFRARGYRTVATPYFLIKTKENNQPQNRFGVIIGRSFDKKAVVRNYWERRVKSQLLKFPAQGKDIICICQPRVKQLTPEQFNAQFDALLTKP